MFCELCETAGVIFGEGFGFIKFQKLAHPPARRAEQHIAKSEKLIPAQRQNIQYRRSGDILEAKMFAVFAEHQIIGDGFETVSCADLSHKGA